MVKSSIKRKVLRIVLGMSLISLFVVCVATFTGLLGIRTQIQHSGARLGEFAVQNSSAFLEREATNRLSARAKDQAQIINERLNKIEEMATYYSEYTTGIYKNATTLGPKTIPYSTDENNGKLTMQLQSANGKSDYPAIKQEVELLGNIAPAYESNRLRMDVIAAVYLGTETGFSILYDPFSADENQSFDPRTRPWYIGARDNRGIFWTQPYIDAASGNLMITCSYPFYGAYGEFMGVTGIDVIIEALNDEIANISVGADGYAFIVDSDGVLISSRELESDDPYERKTAYKQGEDEYNKIIYNMLTGITGVETTGDLYIAYSQIPTTGWSVGMVLPNTEIVGIVEENRVAIQAMTYETMNYVNLTIMFAVIISVILFATVAFLVYYFSERFSAKITQPIISLEEGLERIACGDLDLKLEIKTGDELEVLADCVNSMTLDLKEYINNLQHVTAENERIGAELNVATRIQASMLPCIFPPFPEREEFDIYAVMTPAKEVGGDFYDFFLIDDNKLVIVVADVSGKGVPAALFMVIAKTLIKNDTQSGKPPNKVFETVNNMLCENNEAGMFVTAFMGVLEISTGRFTYVNAGHNPPLIRKGGKYQWLPTKPGFVLAGMEEMAYVQDEIILNQGDMLYLYTDGVTEAVNCQLELFGEQRLFVASNKFANCGAKIFLTNIKSELDTFASTAEQADDITMLALEVRKESI